MPFAVQLPSSSDGALAKGGRRPADDKEQSLTPLGTLELERRGVGEGRGRPADDKEQSLTPLGTV